MKIKEKNITLKNGEAAVIRNATKDDVKEIIQVVNQTSKETPFLSRTQGEDIPTIDNEIIWIQNKNNSPNELFLICEINNKIIGTFGLIINNKQKLKHRASIGISLIKDAWGLGIGTELFIEAIRVARNNQVEILELCFIEGNSRARGLYEKIGFKITGRIPNAIKYNNQYLDEYMMQMKL